MLSLFSSHFQKDKGFIVDSLASLFMEVVELQLGDGSSIAIMHNFRHNLKQQSPRFFPSLSIQVSCVDGRVIHERRIICIAFT